MNFDKTYKYLPYVFLDLIHIGPEEFLVKFRNFSPTITPHIDSFKHNPGCDCRNKIMQFIEENRESSFNFLEDWFKNNNQFEYLKGAISPDIIEQKYVVTEVNGKVFEIDDTPEAFLVFKEKMETERFTYRNSHLIKVGEKLKIYFL